MQHIFPDEFTIRQTFAIRCDHRTVCRPQILGRQTKPPCCFCNQQFARLRRRILDRGAAVLHGVAACRIALVRGQARVRRRHLEGFKGNVQLLSRDLLKRCLEALTEFGLAREHLNPAIGVDADPRVEIGRCLQAAGRGRCGNCCGRVLLLRQRA